MKRPIEVAVAVAAALSLIMAVSPASAITNGTPDNRAHPNVGIMYMDNLPALASGFCSGSLLSDDELLVAGHCTAGLSAYEAAGLISKSNVHVSFDEKFSVDADGVISTATWVAVTGWVTHPNLLYSSGILRNDVGVLHLATAQAATPIELPEAGFLDAAKARGALSGHDFVNVGYGLNAASLDRSVSSPKAVMTWDQERMVSKTPFVALASNDLHQDGGVGGGDSGGPHFWADGSNLVVAVTSSGNPVGGLNAAQRLDIQPVLDFLEDYVD